MCSGKIKCTPTRKDILSRIVEREEFRTHEGESQANSHRHFLNVCVCVCGGSSEHGKETHFPNRTNIWLLSSNHTGIMLSCVVKVHGLSCLQKLKGHRSTSNASIEISHGFFADAPTAVISLCVSNPDCIDIEDYMFFVRCLRSLMYCILEYDTKCLCARKLESCLI